MIREVVKKVKDAKRVQITGDAGVGKTTLAKKLAHKLDLPLYSTDDFFWKEKFTIPNNKDVSVEKISSVYERDEWLVEGSSPHLIQPGLERSDIIIRLELKSIFHQWRSVIKRNRKRSKEDKEGMWSLISFLTYITRKRFGIFYSKEKLAKKKIMFDSYKDKTVNISSFREINELVDRL